MAEIPLGSLVSRVFIPLSFYTGRATILGMGKGGAFVARSEALRGTRIGSYEIVRLIGHGATASVFEATHVALGKPVAMKLLHEHLADDEQIRERFLREGRVAAKLRHPNTVIVLDVGAEAGVPYLVMELLAGTDLRTLLTDLDVLTVDHALAILLPIASALAQAHDAGVLHRDLKPANIFLARDVRDDVVPKLVDFGLSKIAGGESTSSLTATELVAGTVLYMAPEQTLGVRHSSPASDQYSLASILYEAVAGEPPFAADGVYALIERIRNEVARPPSHVNARIPEALDDVILKAMQREPANRYPSVRAFARALMPFASETTMRPLERDFVERASASTQAATTPSRPSIKKAVSEAETRHEAREVEARVTEPEADVEASSIRASSPLPCAPGESPFRIKGMPYRGFVYLVNKMVPGGLDAFVEKLDDPRLRVFIRQPFLASVRYDVLPFLPLFTTLSRILDVQFELLVSGTAAAQARYDARTVFQRIFSGATPRDLSERISRFGAQYYDFGKMSGTNPEPGVTVLVHAGVPAYVYPWYSPMHVAYSTEVARVCGATSVEATSSETVLAGAHGPFPLVTARTEIRWTV
jgi:serine/threonine protein kinase